MKLIVTLFFLRPQPISPIPRPPTPTVHHHYTHHNIKTLSSFTITSNLGSLLVHWFEADYYISFDTFLLFTGQCDVIINNFSPISPLALYIWKGIFMFVTGKVKFYYTIIDFEVWICHRFEYFLCVLYWWWSIQLKTLWLLIIKFYTLISKRQSADMQICKALIFILQIIANFLICNVKTIMSHGNVLYALTCTLYKKHTKSQL